MDNNIRKGYLDMENDKVVVRMQKGQNIAGYPIGIIYIDDVYYPMMPGNIVNGYTFSFPVRLKAVEGLDIPNLFQCEDSVGEAIYKACQKLQSEGVRAISSACGFFGNYQKEIAEVMDVPVALSSLLQLPWIASLIRPEQKIGVLTADISSLTDRIFDNCGISDSLRDRLIIKDLGKSKEFSCILEGRGEFDNGIVTQELTEKALEAQNQEGNLGAILLECSDMPPYAYAIQAATGLPVFDFTTMINWLHMSVAQKPYCGFI